MVKHAWVVFGAVASGVAIATVLEGTSSWGALAVLATLAITLATTVAVRLMRQPAASSIRFARTERQRREQERFDHDLVARVHEIVSDRTIDWLGLQDFGSKWREAPLAPLRELRCVDAVASAPFGDDLEDAIACLYVAAGVFLDFYDVNTRPDALVIGSEWRELGPRAGTGAPAAVETPDVLSGVRAQLVERAAAVTYAWGVLVAVESRAQQRSVRGAH